MSAKGNDLAGVIVKSFEEEGLSAEDIAGGLGLEPSVVREVLKARSREYRLQLAAEGRGEEAYPVVHDDEWATLVEAYKGVVFDAENTPPAVRERGLRWLIDEKKGRNTVRAAQAQTPPGLTLNILTINNRLREIQQKQAEALKTILPA
jgi:hypothetical protein